MILRFIGTEGEVHGQGLSMFGQSVNVPDAEARAAIAANLPAIPAADFDALGFTPEELEKYRYPAARANCSPEFAAKWRAARERLHELREDYRGKQQIGTLGAPDVAKLAEAIRRQSDVLDHAAGGDTGKSKKGGE